jgi:peptidoglycan/LPS O-acetylase OafA/YrhL
MESPMYRQYYDDCLHLFSLLMNRRIVMRKSNMIPENASAENRNPAQNRPAKLTGADGIRAIACLSVIIHHFSQNLAMQFQPKVVQEIQSLTLLGNAGVSIFFVLSGFLLSYPFWKHYLNGSGFPGIRQYAVRRAARIIPGYYTSMLVCTIIVICFHIPSEMFWTRLAAGLTFTAGFHYTTFFPNEINNPFWSISFEVFCYFLLPLFMYALYKISGRKRTFLKSFLYWIGVFAFILCLNKLIHVFLTPDDVQRGWQYGSIGGAKYWMPNYNPVGFFGHFTIGILAAGITTRLFQMPEKTERFRRAYGFDIVSLLCLAGSAVLLWNVRKLPEFSLSIQSQPYYFPFLTLLVGGVLAAAPHSNIVGKLLDNRFLRFTAQISFGLYIWYYLIIFIVRSVWVKEYLYMGMGDIKAWGIVSSGILVASFAVAALSYRFIEKPVLDWAHKKLPSKKARTDVAM